MPVAVKLLSIPVALFLASSLGVVGSWAMPVGAVLLLAASVAAAVAMESRDLTSVEALSPRVEALADEPLLEAA